MLKNVFKYPPETPEQRVIWEGIFLLIITVAVGFFGRFSAEDVFYTGVISAIFAVNLIIRFIMLYEKGDWMFYVLGVIFGGGNDLMSMIQGVYGYTSVAIVPALSGLMPLWMILFWGQAFLILRKVFALKWIKGEEFKKDGRFLGGWVNGTLIFDIVVLLILRMAIYNTYMMEWWIPGGIYAGVILLRYIIIPPKLNQLNLMAIMPYAFVFEGLLVTFGLYVYINPVFLGMPLWLYFWWIFLMPTIVKAVFDRVEYFVSSIGDISKNVNIPAGGE